jgi:putative spermidine/putrescine transport system permease protein
MNARWRYFLVPGLVVTLVLLVASQYMFIKGSFYEDLGLGRIGDELIVDNYVRFFTDSFYLRSLWLTIKVALLATLFTLLLGYPVAYVIARSGTRLAMLMMAAIVMSSFISIVIKVFGLMIIFSSNGWINQALLGLGILDRPFTIIGNISGVIVGLIQYSLGFAVLLLYSVIQTIPPSLEEAAQIHGASRARVLWRIVFPLSLPGVIVGALTLFNLNMGAFTSAALLGGGRIFTLPVLIQKTVIFDVKYSMAGTIAAVLLVSVLLINLLSILVLRRLRATSWAIA